MAAPVIYRSSDPSAPVLDGQNGSLVAVLDGCLVNGYTGRAAAGWSKPYSGTSLASYRQGGGNQFYLDVNDAGPGGGGGREARVRGYEAMTAVGTGTGPFPTVAQQTNGLFPRKSTAASAAVRQWIMFADDRSFYLFALTGDAAGVYYSWGFGDLYAFKAGDGYRTLLHCHSTENSSASTGALCAGLGALDSSASAGCYAARGAAGTGTSLTEARMAVGTSFAFGSTFPASDGSLLLSRILAFDAGPVTARGWLRGLWQVLHAPAGFNDGDTFSGAGTLAGRTFRIVKGPDGTSNVAAVETTAWDTST